MNPTTNETMDAFEKIEAMRAMYASLKIGDRVVVQINGTMSSMDAGGVVIRAAAKRLWVHIDGDAMPTQFYRAGGDEYGVRNKRCNPHRIVGLAQ